MPGSISDRACRPSRSEIYVLFPETRVNTGYDPLETPPTENTPPIVPGPTSGQLDSYLQPTIYSFFLKELKNITSEIESKCAV